MSGVAARIGSDEVFSNSHTSSRQLVRSQIS